MYIWEISVLRLIMVACEWVTEVMQWERRGGGGKVSTKKTKKEQSGSRNIPIIPGEEQEEKFKSLWSTVSIATWDKS